MATNKVDYTIDVDTLVANAVTFKVTRSEPTDNDPVIWVANVTEDANGKSVSHGSYPALWGEASSLVASTQPFSVAGATKGTAWVTVRPWEVNKRKPSVVSNAIVEYEVA